MSDYCQDPENFPERPQHYVDMVRPDESVEKVAFDDLTVFQHEGQPKFDHVLQDMKDGRGRVIFEDELARLLTRSGVVRVVSMSMPTLDVVIAKINYEAETQQN